MLCFVLIEWKARFYYYHHSEFHWVHSWIKISWIRNLQSQHSADMIRTATFTWPQSHMVSSSFSHYKSHCTALGKWSKGHLCSILMFSEYFHLTFLRLWIGYTLAFGPHICSHFNWTPTTQLHLVVWLTHSSDADISNLWAYRSRRRLQLDFFDNLVLNTYIEGMLMQEIVNTAFSARGSV